MINENEYQSIENLLKEKRVTIMSIDIVGEYMILKRYREDKKYLTKSKKLIDQYYDRKEKRKLKGHDWSPFTTTFLKVGKGEYEFSSIYWNEGLKE